MPIISVSLSDKILKELDLIQKDLGFSGRSETIRAAVKMLITENKEKQKLTGNLSATLLIIHNKKYEETITNTKHEFEDIIITQTHNHLQEDRCLEIFILNGDASRIKQLVRSFRKNGKIDCVKLIIN